MFKFITKKSNKKISKKLKNICEKYEHEIPTTKCTAYNIEPFDYKPMVIDALRDRASLEYFKSHKI